MTFLLFALLTSPLSNPENAEQACPECGTNKQIPSVIAQQVHAALAYYPELKETAIRFVFTPRLKRSVMAARPIVGSLFRNRRKRAYTILINPVFKLKHTVDPVRQIPDSVLIGWIGHELGHIMDYERRNTWSIAAFGISYGLSKRYVRKAERVADTFAINRGMGHYLVATKNFILDHADLPQRYKAKIAELYLSPDDIMELVIQLEDNGQDPDEVSETLLEAEQVTNDAEAESG